MPRNARTYEARLKPRRAALLVFLLTAVIGSADAAGDQGEQRRAYLAKQSQLTQQIRDINNDLTADLEPLTGQQEDTYESVMRNGTTEGTAEFEILKAGLKLDFFKASDPALKQDPQAMQFLKKRLQDVLLTRAGMRINGRRQKEAFRRLVCLESLELIKELLKNNYNARSLAVGLLPELQPVDPPRPDDPQRRLLDEAATVLADILKDEEQPDSLKVRAAYSIAVYLERTDPGGSIDSQLAVALKQELSSWLPADGYQLLLLEAMARLRIAREVAGNPRRAIVYEGLVSIMQDKRRSPLIRCRAAGAIGTVGYDSEISFEPLAWKLVQLSAEMGAAYNKDRRYKHWHKCGEQLYLAFRPAGLPDDGMLNRAERSELVRAAYGKVLPIAVQLIWRKGAIDEKLIGDAAQWASDNQPQNLRFDPNSPPVAP